MSNIIQTLDKGFIEIIDHMGNDLSIVRNARQSYDAAWRAGDDENKDEKLMNSLSRDKHTGPFEHVVINFGIKAPIFVVRQWHRHRTQSYSEVSARYTELPEEVYIPNIDVIGIQSKTNKQARDALVLLTNEETKAREEEIQWVQEHAYTSFKLYHRLIDRGWARELARGVLPMATYTKFSATANLHNWFHFLRLRLASHAQYEIRVYAQAMIKLIEPLYPVAVRGFIKNLPEDCIL